MRPALLALLLALLPSLLLAADPPASTAPLFDDNGTPLTVAQFVEKYIPADMPEGLGRKEVQAALEDAGANWVELARGLAWASLKVGPDSAKSLAYSEPFEHPLALVNAIWLVVSAPHLDRLELDADSIGYFGVGMMAGLPNNFDASQDWFRRYWLNYRFDDEPVSSWRFTFMMKFAGIDKDLNSAINRIVSTAVEGFTVVEKGYFGNLSDPLSLLNTRAGTERELSLLVGAALRASGYATRYVRENRSGKSWLEVYIGDWENAYDAQAWTPVYPTAPDKTGAIGYATELCGGRICVVTAGDAFGREQVTGRYLPLGYVEPKFMHGGPDGPVHDSDFSGWAITAWNDKTGSFVPLDDLEYPSGDKDYPLDGAQPQTPEGVYALGPGDYRLEWGVRYPGGVTHVQSREFSLQHAEQLKLTLPLDPPADLPQTALVERDLGDFAESNRLMKRGRYVFLVGDGGEPSLRAYELLKPLESRSSVFFQHWRIAGATDEDRAFVKDELKVDLEKDQLPVVIVVVDGRATMYLRGYNLNIKDWVERALGAGNAE